LCGDAGKGAHAFFFRASDGTRLYGAVLGQGGVGLVVANDVPHPLCEEVPIARALARRGLRVMVFDYRGRGESEPGRHPTRLDLDVVAAAKEIARRGARTVVVLGAYAGASLALVAAGAPSVVDGVVGVSAAPRRGQYMGGPYSGPGALDVAKRLRIPVLLMAVRTDEFVPVRQDRQLLHSIGSRDKRLVVFPYGRGGWDLFNLSPFGNRPTRLIQRFAAEVAARAH
jgi:pimeloyl-ACP methyl ester carboxylesterase